MMKTKHLLILAVAVAVLAGISIGQKASHRKTTSRPATAVLLDAGLEDAGAARIVLGYGDEPQAVVLERAPEGWIVPTAWNARAADAKVDGVLRTLAGLAGEFRSDRAGMLADYGLDGSATVSIRVEGRDGAVLADLDVGTAPQGAQGQFVRRPGSNAVYLAAKSVLAPLGLYGGPARPGSRHFLELQAIKEDRIAVDRIVLRDEHGTRTLAKVFGEAPAGADSTAAPQPDRQTWEWVLMGSDLAPQKTKADGVLGAAVAVRAVDVDDPSADPAVYGLDAPSRTATLVFADGRELVLAFGADRPAEGDRPAGVWMRAGDDPTVWVATTYTVGNIFKTAADLLPGS